MGCAGAWSLHPIQIAIAKRVFSPDPAEVAFAKKILDAMPDGTGAVMIDGKMQDDATWKQAKVIVDLARLVAAKDPETGGALRALIQSVARPRRQNGVAAIGWRELTSSAASHEQGPRRQIQDRPGGEAPRCFRSAASSSTSIRIFNNTEEWWQSIPAEVRPRKDQPFYHLFAENAETEYIAYVSEQNLLPDTSGEPVRHPQVAEVFEQDEKGGYRPRNSLLN